MIKVSGRLWVALRQFIGTRYTTIGCDHWGFRANSGDPHTTGQDFGWSGGFALSSRGDSKTQQILVVDAPIGQIARQLPDQEPAKSPFGQIL